MEVYAVEYDGAVSEDGGNKIAVERCRLVRRLNDAELAAVRIFVSGSHEVRGGDWIRASGSAQVTASDSAQVTASGSAKVTASDSAQVEARNWAIVDLHRRSAAKLWGEATAVARDEATFELHDDARVVDRRKAGKTRTVRAKAKKKAEAAE